MKETSKMMQRWLGLIAVLTGAVLLVAAKPVAHTAANRSALVTVTPTGSHLLGDPAAKLKLTEYISYTCPHCAHFHEESDATLHATFLAGGKGSIEVVPFIRNSIDMAASLLVECGGPTRFVRLHDIFLNTQAQWTGRMGQVSEAQRARWDNGPMGGRMRAMASDLGLYQIMEANGVDRVQADRCLNDEAAMKRLAAQTQAASVAGVEATPTFAIDGVILTGTYDWATLAPQIRARL